MLEITNRTGSEDSPLLPPLIETQRPLYSFIGIPSENLEQLILHDILPDPADFQKILARLKEGHPKAALHHSS